MAKARLTQLDIMKKDIKNVVITFSLIALMLYGGSFLYTKKVLADEEMARIEVEREEKELRAQEFMQQELIKRWEESERLFALQQKKIEPIVEAVAQVAVQKTTSIQSDTQNADVLAQEQANYIAQKQATTDALLKQKAAQLQADRAAADALAQQIAAEKAAAAKVAAAKKKANRASRAS